MCNGLASGLPATQANVDAETGLGLPPPREHPTGSALQVSLGGGEAPSVIGPRKASLQPPEAPRLASGRERGSPGLGDGGGELLAEGPSAASPPAAKQPQPQQPQISCVRTEGPPGLGTTCPTLLSMPTLQTSVLGLQLPRMLPEPGKQWALQGELIQRLILYVGFLAVAFGLGLPHFFL